MNSETYRGFTIQKDQLLGWSLICPKGAWCCSMISKEKIRDTVDGILNE